MKVSLENRRPGDVALDTTSGNVPIRIYSTGFGSVDESVLSNDELKMFVGNTSKWLSDMDIRILNGKLMKSNNMSEVSLDGLVNSSPYDGIDIDDSCFFHIDNGILSGWFSECDKPGDNSVGDWFSRFINPRAVALRKCKSLVFSGVMNCQNHWISFFAIKTGTKMNVRFTDSMSKHNDSASARDKKLRKIGSSFLDSLLKYFINLNGHIMDTGLQNYSMNDVVNITYQGLQMDTYNCGLYACCNTILTFLAIQHLGRSSPGYIDGSTVDIRTFFKRIDHSLCSATIVLGNGLASMIHQVRQDLADDYNNSYESRVGRSLGTDLIKSLKCKVYCLLSKDIELNIDLPVEIMQENDLKTKTNNYQLDSVRNSDSIDVSVEAMGQHQDEPIDTELVNTGNTRGQHQKMNELFMNTFVYQTFPLLAASSKESLSRMKSRISFLSLDEHEFIMSNARPIEDPHIKNLDKDNFVSHFLLLNSERSISPKYHNAEYTEVSISNPNELISAISRLKHRFDHIITVYSYGKDPDYNLILHRIGEVNKNGGINKDEANDYSKEKTGMYRVSDDPSKTFDNILTYHQQNGHCGIHNTFTNVSKYYYNINRQMVEFAIKLCSVCSENNSSKAPKAARELIPIDSCFGRQRCQIDLIDISYLHAPGTNFIFHAKDHFSRFSTLLPLKSKSADSVSSALRSFLRLMVHTPVLVQTDNGKEFRNKQFEDVLSEFNVVHICGAPRKPSTQGSVERANRDVKQLFIKLYQSKVNEITSQNDVREILEEIHYAINSNKTRATGTTPASIYFRTEECFSSEMKNIYQAVKTLIKLDLRDEKQLEMFALILDELVPIKEEPPVDIEKKPEPYYDSPNPHLGHSSNMVSALEHGYKGGPLAQFEVKAIDHNVAYKTKMKEPYDQRTSRKAETISRGTPMRLRLSHTAVVGNKDKYIPCYILNKFHNKREVGRVGVFSFEVITKYGVLKNRVFLNDLKFVNESAKTASDHIGDLGFDFEFKEELPEDFKLSKITMNLLGKKFEQDRNMDHLIKTTRPAQVTKRTADQVIAQEIPEAGNDPVLVPPTSLTKRRDIGVLSFSCSCKKECSGTCGCKKRSQQCNKNCSNHDISSRKCFDVE